jgi:hypothetical protein
MGHFLALGVDLGARRDDTIRLTLNERDLLVSLDNDMASLTSSLGSHNALDRDDLASKGGLGAKGVHGEANFFKLEGHIRALQLKVVLGIKSKRCEF